MSRTFRIPVELSPDEALAITLRVGGFTSKPTEQTTLAVLRKVASGVQVTVKAMQEIGYVVQRPSPSPYSDDGDPSPGAGADEAPVPPRASADALSAKRCTCTPTATDADCPSHGNRPHP
jgi:hypothetical protein